MWKNFVGSYKRECHRVIICHDLWGPKNLELASGSQVDNTVRENKNSTMVSYLSWLASSHFRVASMLFGQAGHTHNRLGWMLRSICHREVFRVSWYIKPATEMRCMACWLLHFDMCLNWWTPLMWSRSLEAFRDAKIQCTCSK